MTIRYFNISHLHRIDELTTVKMSFRPTYQRLDAVVGMVIQKTTPIIRSSFPNCHIFQVVNRSLIERRNMVDIVANATVQESIFIHILYPSQLTASLSRSWTGSLSRTTQPPFALTLPSPAPYLCSLQTACGCSRQPPESALPSEPRPMQASGQISRRLLPLLK